MKKYFSALLVVFILFASVSALGADDYEQAKSMIYSGQLEAGAQMLARYVKAHPRDKKNTPKALLLLGQTLDRLQDLFAERAEMACYWGKGKARSPECMRREADRLNAFYGAGAFRVLTNIAYMPYTGIHYQQIVRNFSKSKEAPEAEFQLLLKDLVGHPDVVLPKVKKFMQEHKSGDVHRKALLLWARVNEDIWYIHREWSWVLYNERVAPEELMIRAEPYRQEALKTYRELSRKYGSTFEGSQAKRELALLQAQQFDNTTYSILADSVGGTPDKWGNPIPPPKLRATERGVGAPGWNKPEPGVAAPATTSAPAPTYEPAKEKPKTRTPKRWQ